MRLQVGQRVLHFVLERKLGEGGFGEVWRAKAGLASTALKFVSVAGEDLQRGRKEYSRVKLMIENGAFNHDRLIKLHGAWLLDENGEDIPDAVLESAVSARTMELPDQMVEPDTLLIQMDLAQESLASLLKRLRKGAGENDNLGIPVEDLLRYIRQAAEGIDFLNTPRTTFDGQLRGAVYHCDIKPENLLIADGKVRICDYGVARIEGQRKTRSPNALSLAHASPELVEDRPCAQSDQYSLAVSYAQLRTGKLPFKSDVLEGTWRTVMRAVTAGELDLSALEPRERAIVKKATSLNPAKRYRTATEFARELSRVVIGHTGGGGEDGEDAMPRARRRIPWKTMAAVLLLAGGIAAGAYYGPQYWSQFSKTTTVDPEFAKAQAAFRQHMEDAEGGGDLSEFDRLATLASSSGVQLAPQDLTALRLGTTRHMNRCKAYLDREESGPLPATDVAILETAKSRMDKHLEAEPAKPFVNRIELLLARSRLREAWPDPAKAPTARLVLFSEGDRLTQVADGEVRGLVESDDANLAVLQVLMKWPGDPSKVNFAEMAPVYAQAMPLEPAPGEKARLQAIGEQLQRAAKQYVAEHGLDEAITADGIDWQAIGVDPVTACLEAAVEKDRTGDKQGAKRLLDSIASFTGENGGSSDATRRRIEWFNALLDLEGADISGAFAKLETLASAAEPADLDRLAPELTRHAVRPLPAFDPDTAWASGELKLLNQAIALCDRVPAPRRTAALVAARQSLLRQRAVVRLLLPADASNNWAAWRADCEAGNSGSATSNVPLEPFPVALAEFKVTSPENSIPVGFASSGAEDLNAALPGYLDHVEALAEFARGDTTIAADHMVAAHGAESSTAHIAGLDWPERRAKAAEILLAAARELRSKEDRDLRQPAFTAEGAAKARDYLRVALASSTAAAPADSAALLALATYYADPSDPPTELSAEVERLLADDPTRAGLNANGLLLLSARLAAAAQQQELAADRFGEALLRYEAWSRSTSSPASDDAILEVYREAIPAADALYDKLKESTSSPLRSRLAAIYGGAAVRLARLAGEQRQFAETALLAKCFERGNTLDPRPDTLRAEVLWRKHMHSGRPDGELERLRKLADQLPKDDPAATHVRAYALLLKRGEAVGATKQAAELKQSIALYDQLLNNVASTSAVDPKLYLERGDAYLQLAHVAHRARAELKEDSSSIFGYLTEAQRNADAVLALDTPSWMQVEANNLWGNSSEDMAYYSVDSDKSAWAAHYDAAIDHFKRAYDEDSESPYAPFNLARCRFRRIVDERRYHPENASNNVEDIAKAVNAMQAALTNWGEAEAPKKAEAYYWLSMFQQDLHEFDEADATRGQAVAMAERLRDPNWQTYQYEWASLAVQRWVESTPANRDALKTEATARAMKLLTVARDTASGLRVDPANAARAIGFLIQLEKDVDASVRSVEQNLASFAGDDPINRACRAQIRLALAERIIALRYANSPAFAALKPKGEAYAAEVLTLTADPSSVASQAAVRSKAHWVLGELDRTAVDPEKSQADNVALLNQAREHYRAGIEEIGKADLNSNAIAVRLMNVLGDAASTANLSKYVKGANFRPIAKATVQNLTVVRPQIAGLLPTQIINGDSAADWLQNIDKTSQLLQNVVNAP